MKKLKQSQIIENHPLTQHSTDCDDRYSTYYYKNTGSEIEFVFFQPDELKAGGAYISVSGIVKKIDEYESVVILKDGRLIPIKDIIDITGDIIQAMDVLNE